jgi:7-cyano-7-deazaguanine tRNA-ribosyltransferase
LFAIENTGAFMHFYVSWYPGDPFYPLFDDECCLLISISSVPNIWTIERFPRYPIRLLIDSGGYRFALSPKEALSPKDVFYKQLSIIGDIHVPTIICARDFPILNHLLTSNQKDALITNTIAFAYEFKNLLMKKNLNGLITPMAIVQGYDENSLQYCAHELKNIGFEFYGIGSLAAMRHSERIMQRLRIVSSILGPKNLHVFGVSAIETIQKMKELGIHSIDSARPAKAAAYNELLYSNPISRYGILDNKESILSLRGKFPLHRRLSKPLPCDCPICKKNPSLILGIGKRSFIRNRAVHNYYHLKKIIVN